MKVLIIEDEVLAAKALKKVLKEVDSEAEVLAVHETVEETVEWIGKHPAPDLMFLDIHLADGSSFAIFEQVNVTCPVVFTTAYDEYAIKAFEVNSIDYLLKPISKEAMEHAMRKYHSIVDKQFNSNKLDALLTQLGNRKKYRNCFLLPERDKLVPLPVNNIAYVYIDTKTVKIVSLDQKTYYISQTLDDLMAQLDPTVFFRANRQFIVPRHSVKDVSVWFGNKLAINLVVETPEKIIVSKARVAEFKHWFSN